MLSIADLVTLVRMFPEALLGGVLIAAVCALLGVFVILRRVVFIGITLSEVAACGIASAMWCGLPPFVGAAILTLAAVAFLAQPFESRRIPRDAALGVLFVGAGAAAILLMSRSGFGLHEVKALLYGDLILTTRTDLALIAAILVPVAAYLVCAFRPTLYAFMDRDAARALRVRVRLWEMLYFVALGLTVSAASKVAGALLVFGYLVVAPSTALLLSRRIVPAILLAVAIAVGSTLTGILLSFKCDLPTNQTISIIACACFLVAVIHAALRPLFARSPRPLEPQRRNAEETG